MVIKRHISGICVAYPEDCGSSSGKLIHGLAEGREQGSHYNQQKRRIADAVTHLQQSARDDCKPLIFVATSPGYVDHSNEPRFISKFVDYLKKVYSMERYVWVREFTKLGFPHFHFVANIPINGKSVTLQNKGKPITVPFDPIHVSEIWSHYYGRVTRNAIRLGSKPNKHGVRMFYLNDNRRKAWYLAKYIGKSRGTCETKKRLKSFHMDEKTSAAIEPNLFRSKYVTDCKVVSTWNAHSKKMEDIVYDVPTGERIFEDENGNLFSPHGIDWRSVGHDVYVGFEPDLSQKMDPISHSGKYF